jgi:hypothetical protein
MAELTAAFVLGLVCGLLLKLGWLADGAVRLEEPTEHGGRPL